MATPPRQATPTDARPIALVVMGVSGCGKTTVGRRVASHLGWAFLEGDTLHPTANVAKMRAGHALDDCDRKPWLEAIGDWLDARRNVGASAVIACSALKRRYRESLDHDRPGVCFAWLKVGRAELERRLRERTSHFMPATLLDSQLVTLEPPDPDEPAFTVDASGRIEATVRATLDALDATLAPGRTMPT